MKNIELSESEIQSVSDLLLFKSIVGDNSEVVTDIILNSSLNDIIICSVSIGLHPHSLCSFQRSNPSSCNLFSISGRKYFMAKNTTSES